MKESRSDHEFDPSKSGRIAGQKSKIGARSASARLWARSAICPPKLGGQARSAGWFLSDPLETRRLRNHPACAAGSRTAYCPPKLRRAVRVFPIPRPIGRLKLRALFFSICWANPQAGRPLVSACLLETSRVTHTTRV